MNLSVPLRALAVSALLSALAILACSRRSPRPADSSALSERYRFLQSAMILDSDMPEIRASLPYDRIERSEYSPWGLGGPTLTLACDGTAKLDGAPPKSGRLSLFDFGGLCYLIERIGFESFEPHYAWTGFDAGTTTIKVWRTGSDEPIVVEDYGGVGPLDLWTLRASIDGVAAHIRWK